MSEPFTEARSDEGSRELFADQSADLRLSGALRERFADSSAASVMANRRTGQDRTFEHLRVRRVGA